MDFSMKHKGSFGWIDRIDPVPHQRLRNFLVDKAYGPNKTKKAMLRIFSTNAAHYVKSLDKYVDRKLR